MHLPERLVDQRTIEVRAAPEAVFAELERLGGNVGWPSANVLWRLRGGIDSLVGGVGHRRGRRHPDILEEGDHLDFWRVEALQRPRRLRLRAEMRLPGRAWLQFEIEDRPAGAHLVQTAIFDPAGLAGYAYWYLLLPVHLPIFRTMIRELGRRAVRRHTAQARPQPSGS